MKGNEQGNRDLFVGFKTVKVKDVEFQTNNDKSFVVFTLHEPENDITTKISFYVKPEVNKSKDGGKTQFIDLYGRTKWSAKPEDSEYFEAKTARPCGVGEDALTQFVSAYANVKRGEEGRFTSFKTIASGDIKEIEEILTQFPKNWVGVMFGVKDSKYQSVYTGRFERGFAKDAKNIIKALKGDTYNKLYFGEDLNNFRKFNPANAPAPNDDIIDNTTSMEIDYSTNTLVDMVPEDFPVGNDNIIKDEHGNDLF